MKIEFRRAQTPISNLRQKSLDDFDVTLIPPQSRTGRGMNLIRTPNRGSIVALRRWWSYHRDRGEPSHLPGVSECVA